MKWMMWYFVGVFVGMLLFIVSGCSKIEMVVDSGGGVGVVVLFEGVVLVYEYDLDICLDVVQIGLCVKQIVDVCQFVCFGDCVVLQVGQQGGEYLIGLICVCIVFKGVELIIGLVGQGGEVFLCNIYVEDLVQQVVDIVLIKVRLEKEYVCLLVYQDSRIIIMVDLLVVSQWLVEIEVGVEQVNKDVVQQC